MNEETLRKNFEEYWEIAEYSFQKKKFNASVTLYYKALVEICDIELLRKTGNVGANHTDRFELLERCNPSLYLTASKLFRFYRDSYNKEITETVATLVRKEVDHARKTIIH